MTNKSQLSIDEFFMSEAIKEAKLAIAEGNWPIGCVIVLEDQIIARAHNTGYTDHNRLVHAEINALTIVQDFLDKNRGLATLYSTYEPCPMCFGAIILSKIGRVVYGINLDQSGSLDLQQHLPPFFTQPKFRFTVTSGILANECKTVFLKEKMIDKIVSSEFFQK